MESQKLYDTGVTSNLVCARGLLRDRRRRAAIRREGSGHHDCSAYGATVYKALALRTSY